MKAGFSIKLILYFAPNCPQQIVAPNCPTPNCPLRIVRAELSCAELSCAELSCAEFSGHPYTAQPYTCVMACLAWYLVVLLPTMRNNNECVILHYFRSCAASMHFHFESGR